MSIGRFLLEISNDLTDIVLRIEIMYNITMNMVCNRIITSSKRIARRKAKALFIKNHNEDCYVNTLKKAMDSDENFAKTFDDSKSVESAYEMLESYLDNNKK